MYTIFDMEKEKPQIGDFLLEDPDFTLEGLEKVVGNALIFTQETRLKFWACLAGKIELQECEKSAPEVFYSACFITNKLFRLLYEMNILTEAELKEKRNQASQNMPAYLRFLQEKFIEAKQDEKNVLRREVKIALALILSQMQNLNLGVGEYYKDVWNEIMQSQNSIMFLFDAQGDQNGKIVQIAKNSFLKDLFGDNLKVDENLGKLEIDLNNVNIQEALKKAKEGAQKSSGYQKIVMVENEPVAFVHKGEMLYFELKVIYLGKDRYHNQDLYSLEFHDITKKHILALNLETMMRQFKKQAKEESKKANLDGLTQILNRRAFEQDFLREWQCAINYGKNLSVLMLDIDFFKNVNDTHGHPGGDEVLKKVAHFLQKIVRSSDIVARYGGEEFVILLKETSPEDAVFVAEKIRAGIETLKVIHQEREIKITLSLGVGTLEFYQNLENLKPQDLIERADRALYQAKQNGRNRVCQYRNEEDSVETVQTECSCLETIKEYLRKLFSDQLFVKRG